MVVVQNSPQHEITDVAKNTVICKKSNNNGWPAVDIREKDNKFRQYRTKAHTKGHLLQKKSKRLDKHSQSYTKNKKRHESGSNYKLENSCARKSERTTKKSVNSTYESKARKHTHTSKGESQFPGEPPEEGPNEDPETETVVV